MKLQINADYRITTDATNVMLEKKRTVKEDTKHHKAGDEVYDIIGFYSEIEHAYRAMIKHGILTSELESLQTILKYIDRIHQEIKESLSMASLDRVRGMVDALEAEVEKLKRKGDLINE